MTQKNLILKKVGKQQDLNMVMQNFDQQWANSEILAMEQMKKEQIMIKMV